MNKTRLVGAVLAILWAISMGACKRSRPPALRVDGRVAAVTTIPYAAEFVAADPVVEIEGREYALTSASLWRAVNFFIGSTRLHAAVDFEAMDGLPIDPQLTPVEMVVMSGMNVWVVRPEVDAGSSERWGLHAANGPEGEDWQHGMQVDIGLVLVHPVAGFVYLRLPDVWISQIS